MRGRGAVLALALALAAALMRVCVRVRLVLTPLCLATAAVPASAADAAPLGAGPGASRQAWATAAALSPGIGLGALLDAVAAGPDGARFCRSAASAGFRSVRLPLRWPASPPPDEALRPLDALVDGCLARGLTVVLDLPQRPDGWPLLAARYADRPPRLLFQLSFARQASVVARKALLRQTLDAVRRRNPQRIVVVGWDDAIGLPRLAVPADPHLIIAVHDHEPYRFTHQGAPGVPGSSQWLGTGCCSPPEAQLLMLPLDLAQRWSREQRYPVWLSDFRSHASAPLALRAHHARLVRDAAEARGLPWTYGAFEGGFGAHDASTGRWHAPLRQALLGP